MTALAHLGEATEEHAGTAKEISDVASVNPVVALGAIVAAAIIGFLVWRFVIKK